MNAAQIRALTEYDIQNDVYRVFAHAPNTWQADGRQSMMSGTKPGSRSKRGNGQVALSRSFAGVFAALIFGLYPNSTRFGFAPF